MTLPTPEQLLAATLLLPAAAALLAVLFGRMPDLREGAAILAGILLFSAVWALNGHQQAGEEITLTLWNMFPGLSIAFEVEPLGLVFAMIASFLWPVTTLYAVGYMRGNNEQHQTRFFCCFALAIVSAMGIAFAANLLTLFIFYEMMTLCTFPLVTHAGTAKARRSGRTYLGILMFSSIGLQLPMILWLWQEVGSLDFIPGGLAEGALTAKATAVCYFLAIYGVGKAALMPLHRWLPAAMVAPTPVSALLHAVAVVKAGVFTVVKFIVYVFGVDYMDLITDYGFFYGDWLIYMAGATIIIASLVALRQDNLKRRLAYSTISQLSYVLMSAAVLSYYSVLAAVLHIAAHAFGKITLFFAAGSIYTAGKKTEVSRLGGVGRMMPLTMLAFSIGALSMIGVPPTVGFISKWYMLSGAFDVGAWFVVGVIILSTLLNAGYFLPIIAVAFFGKPPADTKPHGEAPRSMRIAISITALGTLALCFAGGWLVALAERIPIRSLELFP